MTNNILLFGSNGQLGRELHKRFSNQTAYPATSITPLARNAIDLTDIKALDDFLTNTLTLKPCMIINASAYTTVDNAEQDATTADAVNNKAVAMLGRYCAQYRIPFIHISTDFVFDGKQSQPYLPDDPCQPLGVYGQTKYAGEQALLQHAPDQSLIIRTSWLYSSECNNFMNTMLRLMAERDALNIVYDQIGTPTSVLTLADLIEIIVQKYQDNSTWMPGIYHWSDAGVASWYDFAVAIYEEASELGILKNKQSNTVALTPIPASQYPTPAQRPGFSVLDKGKTYTTFNPDIIHWREALRLTLRRLTAQ